MNERITAIRKVLRLSQQEFGKKIEITRSSVCKIESGENNPSDQTLKLICREFNVSPQYLREGKGPMFIEPMDDADLVDQVMAGSNEYAKHLIISIVKAGEKDHGWEVLKEALDALKEAGL